MHILNRNGFFITGCDSKTQFKEKSIMGAGFCANLYCMLRPHRVCIEYRIKGRLKNDYWIRTPIHPDLLRWLSVEYVNECIRRPRALQAGCLDTLGPAILFLSQPQWRDIINYDLYLRFEQDSTTSPQSPLEDISKEVEPVSEDKWTIKIGGNLLQVSLFPMKKKPCSKSTPSSEDLNIKSSSSSEDLNTKSAPSIKKLSFEPSPSSEKEVISDENTVKDSNRAIGLDFTIPTGLLEEQTRTMVEFILSLAAQWNMKAFDPQLGRTVHLSDSEIIVAHWRIQNDFILTTVGSDGSTVGGGAFYPEYEKGLSPGAKFWLFAGGLVLILLLFIRYCV